ncbi:MAG TPA: phosphonate ABC transporter substrate-binding protein [Rhodospirillaceae bacterium]|nr:phosphonate ABC transporter substrate-binding protein [Rhodospirillaceae bacterium]
MLPRFLAALMIVGTLLSATPARAADDDIVFGVISTESSTNLKNEWEPFLADMEKRTGLKVKAFFASDYAGIIEGMRFNKVQLAWYGNKSAMEAVDRADGEIFAHVVTLNGEPGYWSLLITHRDSDIHTLDDVIKSPGKYTFGNGDPNSTSGFLVPGYYVFALNKIDPKTHFKRVVSANHETNAMAVLNKQVDIATNNTEEMARIQDRMPDRFKDIRIVWTSPLIPADPIVWRKDLPKETKTKIYNFLTSYGKTGGDAEHDKQVLAALKWSGFEPSSNDQLLPIRQLELFKARAKVENDEKLSVEEKKVKITEIDLQLGELQKKMASSK